MKKAILTLLLIFSTPFCRTLPDVINKPDIKKIDRLIEEKKKQPQTPETIAEIEILTEIKEAAIDNHKAAIIATHEAKQNAKAAGSWQGVKLASLIGGCLLLLGIGGFVYFKFF